MSLQVRAVTVKQFPRGVNGAMEQAYRAELMKVWQVGRPRIVINCANLRALDCASAQLLLGCLEEAMMRNGDVRLSSVPEPAKAQLQLWRLDRLFLIFDTDAEAIRSFQRHAPDVVLRAGGTESSLQPTEHAA